VTFLPEQQALLSAFLDGLQKLRMLQSRLPSSKVYAIYKSKKGIFRAAIEQSS
jgi:hypothetical protein